MSGGPQPWLVQLLVAACFATSALGLLAWRRGASRRLLRVADLLGFSVLVATSVAWILRALAAGRLPTFGNYESSLSLAVFVLAAGAAARWIRPSLGATWTVVGAAAGAAMLHGLAFDPAIRALTISERSWIVDLHALLSWAACGVLAVNAGLGLRFGFGKPPGPAGESGLSWSLRAGFLLHSAMLASGSLYEFLLFGKAWTFDPIETMALSCWMAYGGLLHAHLLAGWHGRRLARWCLGLFLFLVLSYRAVLYFPPGSSFHVFDIDRRIHVVGSDAEPQGVDE
jgi:ABC-type transport system involved in cytochrome c biogenesis permease subunit